MDSGYSENYHAGVDPAKLRAVAHWRESGLYTPLERRVVAYSEAMTATPPEVTDEMVAALRADLSEAELVELTDQGTAGCCCSRTPTGATAWSGRRA